MASKSYSEIYEGNPRAPKISMDKIQIVKDLNDYNSKYWTVKKLSESLDLGKGTVSGILRGNYDEDAINKRINRPKIKSVIAIKKDGSDIRYLENLEDATNYAKTHSLRIQPYTTDSNIRDTIRKAASGTRTSAYEWYWVGCKN